MILVDTAIWVDADRDPGSKEADEIRELISRDEVATTGMVLAEVLQGAANEASYQRLSSTLSALHYFHADRETWVRAAELAFRLRRRGLTTPLSDLVIAQVAIDNDLPVYTSDEHFDRVSGLQLHKPGASASR